METTLSKREANNQRRKTLIVETAISMIEADGIDGFNMKALAEQSGVPRASLYRYYPSQEELCHDIALHWGMNFTANLQPARRTSQLDRALNQTFKAALQEASDRPELLKVVLGDIFSANIDASDFDNDFAQLFFALLERFTDLQNHDLQQDDINILLRLLLANLQLVVSDKVTLDDALKNLAHCVKVMFR